MARSRAARAFVESRRWVQVRWGECVAGLGVPSLSRYATAALARLISGRIAWGHACRFSRRATAELESLGVLARWDLNKGVYITLSPLGASRLGLALFERGPAAAPYWGAAGSEPEPPWVDRSLILLKRPELVPVKHKSVLEYLCDLETGEEVRIFGVPVRIDRRLARGRARVNGKPATNGKPTVNGKPAGNGRPAPHGRAPHPRQMSGTADLVRLS